MKASKKLVLLLCASLVILQGCGKGNKDKKQVEVTTEVTTAATTEEVVVATATEAEKPKDEDGFFLADDYVKVVDELVYVQASPSESSDTYRLYEKDDIIKRTGYTDKWTRVEVDGYDFYIESSGLTVAEDVVAEEPKEEKATGTDADKNDESIPITKTKKIVIDPANQLNVNVDKEEIGPGSEEEKQGASMGHVGVTLETREYDINLQYAMALKEKLEDKGYEVIMTREANDVNISNKSRAELANESGATVFLRIQMNYSENPAMSGVMAVSMKKDNIYNGQFYEESHKFATRLLQGVTENVEVVNHGIYETDQMTAINWSEIPVAVIKIGYLSNEDEEAKLVSDEYMDKIVTGLTRGIEYYFRY